MELVYLDNNATTPLAPGVLEAMMPYLNEWFGNPSSVHRFGQRARHAVDEARAQVAGLIGCAEAELSFTGGGTEAINTVVRGLLAGRPGKNKVVTTVVEHSATRELCRELAKGGTEVIEVGVDQQGTLDMDALRSAVDENTGVVSIMWANNETGVTFPVEEISKICRERRVPFHCDGTQAVGKIPVDVKAIGADAMSMAAHKFHGPKGVGAFFLRRGVRFRPLVIGGPQEHSRRGGTENVAGIVGMGKACALAKEWLPQMGKVAAMRDRLERSILERIEETYVNGRTDLRVPNTSNIGFARLEAEAILLLLSEQGICASAGAACSSGSLEASHVLKGMGIDDRIAHGAIRFSLSKFTTDGEIDRALAILPGVINKLRAVLPVGT